MYKIAPIKILKILFLSCFFTSSHLFAAAISSQSQLIKEIKLIRSEMTRMRNQTQIAPKIKPSQTQKIRSINPHSFRNSSLIMTYQGVAYLFQAMANSQDLLKQQKKLQQALERLTQAYGEDSVLPGSSTAHQTTIQKWIAQTYLALAENQFLQKKYTACVINYGRSRSSIFKSPGLSMKYATALEKTNQIERLKKFVLKAQASLKTQIKKKNSNPQPSPLIKKLALQKQDTTQHSKVSKNTSSRKPFVLEQGNLEKQWESLLHAMQESPFVDFSKEFSKFVTIHHKALAQNQKSQKIRQKMLKNADKIPLNLIGPWVGQLWRSAYLDDAIIIAEKVLAKKHQNQTVANIAYDLGRMLEDRGDYQEAAKIFDQYDDFVANTRYAEDILFRRAWVNYLFKRKKAYITDFKNYLKQHPKGKYELAAKFYLVLSLDSNKHFKLEAEKYVAQFPFSYYSQILAKKMSINLKKILTLASESKSQSRASYPAMSAEDQFLWARFIELNQLELEQESIRILGSIDLKLRSDQAWNQFLVAASKKYHRPRFQTMSAMRLYRGSKNPSMSLLKSLYPEFMKYKIQSVLQQTKSTFNYPTIVSLIRQESAFQTDAKSRVGATGLMQLMPATAREVAAQQKLNSYHLSNPDDNIFLGVSLLNRLSKKYKGHLPYILAAYNAGERVTDLWIKLRGKLSEENFIESIPYLETRKYIQLIQRNIYFYQQLEHNKLSKS